jgi:WD40 repeat protein
MDTRRLIGPRLRLPEFVLGLAFSPDGTRLAIATGSFSDNPDAVEIRDPRSGERLARLPTGNEVRSVAFSPDGRLLAGGQVDGSAQLWATDGWRQLGPPLALRAGSALAVAFSPDGRTLATSHADFGDRTNAVVLWDIESQQPIGSPLSGPEERAPGPENVQQPPRVTARFSVDGSRLFAVYDDGGATRWEIDPGVWRAHACAVAGGLTPEQWEEIVPEQDYRPICPSP